MAAASPFRSLVIAVALALSVAACGRNVGGDNPPERGDRAVARVDGKTVWASDVKREAIAQGLIGEGEPLDASSELFRQMMEQVIDQKLLAAEAQRRKLDKDPLAQRRLTAAQDRVMGDMLVETTVADAVTETNIRGLYEEQQKLAKRSEEIRARQIVLATAAEVEQVRKLLAAGASFDALAMERSRDAATRFNGGDLGYFTTDVMPEGYEAALKDAKSGQIVGPFKTDAGFVVLRVEDRRPEEPITLDAARPQIVRFLTYAEVRDLLENLRKGTKVDIQIDTPQGAAGRPREPDSAPPAPGAVTPTPPAAPAASAPAQPGPKT
jgi:peptidyl-prolyl cis-trans isomerase C